jgi:hypothetical protein
MPTASTSARPSSTGSGKRPRDVVVPPPGPGKFRPKDL